MIEDLNEVIAGQVLIETGKEFQREVAVGVKEDWLKEVREKGMRSLLEEW